MKEIIDSEIESKSGDLYSQKAGLFFVANLLCLLILFLMVSFFTGTINASSLATFSKISNGVILFFVGFGLLGFRYAMLSIYKKEKWTYIKIVGVVGNSLFFVLIILLVAANANDLLSIM